MTLQTVIFCVYQSNGMIYLRHMLSIVQCAICGTKSQIRRKIIFHRNMHDLPVLE